MNTKPRQHKDDNVPSHSVKSGGCNSCKDQVMGEQMNVEPIGKAIVNAKKME